MQKQKRFLILFFVLFSLLFTACKGCNKPEDFFYKSEKIVKDVAKTVNKVKDTIKDISDEKTGEFEKASVLRVVDGDTIIVEVNGVEERVRFIGVDTPETKHPKKGVQYFGPEASAFTKEKLEGKVVYLEKDVSDRDRYNRILRYIWLENPGSKYTDEDIKEKQFNAILVKEGYARISTFPPDVKNQDLYKELEREAREKERGLWKEK